MNTFMISENVISLKLEYNTRLLYVKSWKLYEMLLLVVFPIKNLK